MGCNPGCAAGKCVVTNSARCAAAAMQESDGQDKIQSMKKFKDAVANYHPPADRKLMRTLSDRITAERAAKLRKANKRRTGGHGKGAR